jgi:DNA-binding MarR family transcriptional regulator
MKNTLIGSLPREQIDEILYNAMAAIYQFDQQKIKLFGMTYQDSYILYYLRRSSPVRMSDIATELSVHISTASRAIDRLEHRSLVSRSKDPADKRNILVGLNEAGVQLMKASEDHSYERILSGVKDYSKEELSAVMKAAANLSTILGVPPLNSDPAASNVEKGAAIRRRR